MKQRPMFNAPLFQTSFPLTRRPGEAGTESACASGHGVHAHTETSARTRRARPFRARRPYGTATLSAPCPEDRLRRTTPSAPEPCREDAAEACPGLPFRARNSPGKSREPEESLCLPPRFRPAGRGGRGESFPPAPFLPFPPFLRTVYILTEHPGKFY